MGVDVDVADLASPPPPSLRAGAPVSVEADGTVTLTADGARLGRLESARGASSGRVRTLRREAGAVVGVSVRLDEARKEAPGAAPPAVPPPRGVCVCERW